MTTMLSIRILTLIPEEVTKKHRTRQYNSNIKFKNHEKINLETDSSNHHHSSYFYRVRPGCDLMYMKEEYLARSIQYIVVHCSATRVNIPFTEEQLLQCHLQRGFKGIGYHFYVTKDGMLHHTRPMAQIGAHAIGFNLHSLAICYEGGLDEQGKPADTRTPLQKETGIGRIETTLSRGKDCGALSVKCEYS